MQVMIGKDYQDMSEIAVELIIEDWLHNQKMVVGFATGATPLGLYSNLIEAQQKGLISFKDVVSFNLDEYIGIEHNSNKSYYNYMFDNLFNSVDIKKENIHLPKSDPNNIDKDIQEYQKLLDENPRDIQILGIGTNGHIGFNEPGSSFDSQTRLVELSEETRESNQKYFDSLKDVPTQAITMGIKDILSSKKIFLLASGAHKAPVIRELLEGPRTTELPASVLFDHDNVVLVIDEAAASLLSPVEE